MKYIQSIFITLTLLVLNAHVAQMKNQPWGMLTFQPHLQAKGMIKKVIQVKNGKYDLLLIGDSITHSIGELEGKYEVFKSIWDKYYKPINAINLGYNGYRTEQILWNLSNGELEFKQAPKVAMVLIGTNNSDDRNFKITHNPKKSIGN